MALTFTGSEITSLGRPGTAAELRCPYCGWLAARVSGNLTEVWIEVCCINRRCGQRVAIGGMRP